LPSLLNLLETFPLFLSQPSIIPTKLCVIDQSVAPFKSKSLSIVKRRMSAGGIQNLKTFDPFADAFRADDQSVQDGLIHVRIQQRNGRKTLTTVQGISDNYDKKKIVKACKKEFACNGTVVEHPEYGEVMQLQGDQRNNICQFLTKIGIAKPDQLKVHGF